MAIFISASLSKEGRDAWPEGVGVRPLLDFTIYGGQDLARKTLLRKYMLE